LFRLLAALPHAFVLHASYVLLLHNLRYTLLK